MKNKTVVLMLLAFIFVMMLPAHAVTANLKWYNNKNPVFGNISESQFGYETATADVSTAYVGLKYRLYATKDVPYGYKSITVSFYKNGNNKRLSTVEDETYMGAAMGVWYPANGYASKTAEASQVCSFSKNIKYHYRITVVMPNDAQGVYGGYLDSKPGK